MRRAVSPPGVVRLLCIAFLPRTDENDKSDKNDKSDRNGKSEKGDQNDKGGAHEA
ncbi:hypothetical protein AB0I84_38845 [Streptomyces spectabilis]|uniref:hypothetical protein n=1 Tax=Streptomyces spectabilis TaxID=68270 RepID=UPI0033C947B1